MAGENCLHHEVIDHRVGALEVRMDKKDERDEKQDEIMYEIRGAVTEMKTTNRNLEKIFTKVLDVAESMQRKGGATSLHKQEQKTIDKVLDNLFSLLKYVIMALIGYFMGGNMPQ